MACPSTCENPPEATGAIGTCDNVTGLCICPPGFDGKDIWRSFNDCHVDQTLRSNFLLGTLVVNSIAALVSLSVLTRLCYHYFRSFGRSRKQSFDDGVAVATKTRNNTLLVRRAQKRRIIALISVQLVGCIFALPYSASILFYSPQTYRYELRYALDFCLAVFHICVFSSYWLSVYVWFKLLPSLPFLAKLYRMKSFVFDKPDMVPRIALANVAAITIVEMLFTFILPSIFFDDTELREAFDTVATVAKMLYCISLCIPAFFFIRAMTKLLSQSVYQMKDLKTDELGFIGKGKNSVRLVRTSLVLLVIIWIGLFIPMLGTDYGLRNRYAFYSPAACAVLVGVISSNFNVGIRMAETVDLAAAGTDPSTFESEGKSDRKPSSKLDRQSLKLLLMDDAQLQQHV